MIVKLIFALTCAFQWTKAKRCLSLHDFWVQKYKNQLFDKNKRFDCSFYRIEVHVITNPSSRLENTPNT